MLLWALAVLSLTCAWAQGPPTQTVLDILKGLGNRGTEMVTLINQAGLTDTLTNGGPFTVFATSNYAFRGPEWTKMQNDSQSVSELMKYHIINGLYKRADLVNEKQLETLAGAKIRINNYLYVHHTTAEGCTIVLFDKMASNGVVHQVNCLLYPPMGTIMDVVSSHPELSTLKLAIQQSGLAEMLQDGAYTLFAPTDTAFQALGNDTVAKLMQNAPLLKKLIEYHIAYGTMYTSAIHSGMQLHNLEEQDWERISKSFFSGTRVDNGKVLKADISATNGVVHEIDHVLIPSHLRSQISSL